MGKIINSSDVSLEFKPWTDKKCRITRLQVIEQIGGKIPNGEIDMILDDEEVEKMITDKNTGTISINIAFINTLLSYTTMLSPDISAFPSTTSHPSNT